MVAQVVMERLAPLQEVLLHMVAVVVVVRLEVLVGQAVLEAEALGQQVQQEAQEQPIAAVAAAGMEL